MILTRTPLRVSFVGGGSDLPSYYRKHGGAVLSTSIDKFIYVATHASYAECQVVLKHSEIERADHREDIEHPIVRTALRKWNVEEPLEISSVSDVPSGTGMGSSSTFTVALLQNLAARKRYFPERTTLAEMASALEIEDLGEPIGKQDQYAAALGGLNILRFHPDDRVTAEPVLMTPEHRDRLERRLLLFYTDQRRRASSILSEQKSNMDKQAQQAVLSDMVALVDPLADAIRSGSWEQLGRILHENWLLKKTLANGIASSDIDAIYDTALRHGADGGKLLGAGGGGYFLFSCPEDRQHELRTALHRLKELPFRFDAQGTQVTFSDEYL